MNYCNNKWLVVSFLWCCLAAPSFAQPLQKLFPNAREVYVTEQQTDDFRLALGPMIKSGGVWFPEREERLAGYLTRHTLELERIQKSGIREITNKIEQQLSQSEARRLFSCMGLDCGSSNAWANHVFQIKQLYGLNRYQYYSAWEFAEANRPTRFVVVYVVKRGNRRVYTQIETLTTDTGLANTVVTNPATILSVLERQNFLVMTGLKLNEKAIELEESHLIAWADALKQRPQRLWVIVGHDYGEGDLDQQQQRSLSYAEKVRDRLIEQGVKAESITARGVGSLAPMGKPRSARVEVLLY